VETRYWDSCCFLGWLKSEPDKVDECEGVIRQAEAGNVLIVTSSLTLTEVIRVKGKPPLDAADEAQIAGFFKHEYILVRELDRVTAEQARRLIWEQKVTVKDAVHVATAVRGGLTRMDTFDDKLIKRSGKIAGLIIGRPDVPHQLEMAFDALGEEPEDDQ
jgi:predicted nucleic acid-binding protein